MLHKLSFFVQNDEKNGFDFSQKQLRLMSEGNNRMEITWLVAKKLRKGRSTNQRVLKAMRRDSWRVPHKKSSEKNPGFNLDYSPPKTHPPSHN